jgi:predicted amidophosphoribosyltransferase
MPLALDVLKRTRETKTQTKLTPEERTENVSGAFTAAARLQCRAEVILVDDVLTTGATLVAAAGALVEVGWADVTALTFARAMPLAVQIERA